MMYYIKITVVQIIILGYDVTYAIYYDPNLDCLSISGRNALDSLESDTRETMIQHGYEATYCIEKTIQRSTIWL